MTTDLSESARACTGSAAFLGLALVFGSPPTLDPPAGAPAFALALRLGFTAPALVSPDFFVVLFAFFLTGTNLSVFWNSNSLRGSVYALDRA